MKKYIVANLWMLAIVVVLSSCSDWVYVNPKDQVESEDLFKTELGYKSALIGVYTRMTELDTYGKQMTYGNIENLVQRYDNYGTNKPSDAVRSERYDYKNNASAKSMVKSLWTNMFRTIANVNNLLQNLDANGKNVVRGEYWTLMKGEALGLRAYLYFDLLRLYGPIYTEDPQMKCLPWRTEFNSKTKELLSAEVIAGHIMDDLKEAEQLLADDNLDWDNNLNDVFLGLRKHRMNKLAVKALMARVYLWIGDKENASIKAKEVIDICKKKGVVLVQNNSVDVSMYDETIFCLGMNDMGVKLKSDWANLTSFSNELYISKENLNEVFNKPVGIGVNDIRFRSGYGFIYGSNGNLCRKYLGEDVLYKEKIPLIRLSEMYYIMAESVSLSQSVQYLNDVRNARGISRSYNFAANDSYDENVRFNELNKEYQKDFFAEGQWFYFLKRHNCSTFYRCPLPTMNAYVLPTPDDEIEFGVGAEE